MGLEYKIFDLFYLNNPDYSLNGSNNYIDCFTTIYLYKHNKELMCMKNEGLYVILQKGGVYERN